MPLPARIDAPVRAGEPHVAIAWQQRREGRKHFTASVLVSPSGEVVAVCNALWIELRDPSGLGARV